jgi:hypothetical protein
MTASRTADVEVLLLADSSPALRRRVLTELLDVPADDPEVADLAARLATAVLADMPAVRRDDLSGLGFRLCQLAYAGLGPDDPRVRTVAERVFGFQQDDGSFPLGAFTGRGDRGYDMIPLQTALPLRGLAAAGYATDPRAERAYDWLLAQRLDDGAWPLGTASGQHGFIAGYRRLPGSPGCRANTTGALAALASHPERAHSDAARTALDLLLQRETRDEWTLGWEVARLLGVEPATGFVTFYARFDLAFVLALAAGCGASAEDPRLADLVDFLLARRGDNGLWPHPAHPELTRWLTFDLLLSLRRLAGGDWVGHAFRTPFRTYPRRRHRS